jgi:ubiquinone/menaquinone biosynthesis C-methylase UbiE
VTERDAFGVRRLHEPPVGVPRDFHGTAVLDTALARLAAAPEAELRLSRDTMPIPGTHDREGYYDDRHFEYWLSGLDDYLKVQEACPDVSWRGARLLDFGGATARVSRHFYAQGDLSEITLCDVNIHNVLWVLEHFPSGFGVFKNSWVPSLPIPDRYFDVITAFSVFTHMNEYELAWLYELRRVLKSGGILYVTVHNDDTWRILPSTYVYRAVKESEAFRAVWREGKELADRLVVEYSDQPVYNCNTFHPNAYIHRVWGRVLSVVDIKPLRHDYQSAVLLRNGVARSPS